MAYTEISELYERVYNRFENEDLISKADVLQMIAAAPAPDVEKVVRCKDCKYCERINDEFAKDWYLCKRRGNFTQKKPNDFCSYGKRKEGAGNGN